MSPGYIASEIRRRFEEPGAHDTLNDSSLYSGVAQAFALALADAWDECDGTVRDAAILEDIDAGIAVINALRADLATLIRGE